jgi:hypothetical protein
MQVTHTPARYYSLPINYGGQISSEIASFGSSTASNTLINVQGFAKTTWFYKFGIIILIAMFLTGLAVTEYQQTIQTSVDVLWEGFLFPYIDFGLNYVGVTIKNIYEWTILRVDDVLIYIFDCISDAISQMGEISNIFSLPGIADTIDAVYDGIVCISGWLYNVPSVKVQYLTDFIEQLYIMLICGTDVIEGLLVNILTGTIFSEDCVWCEEFDPQRQCTLVAGAAPGITPICTRSTCHNYERSYFGCLGDFLYYFVNLFGATELATFFRDLMDALGCIMSLYKRPLFVITGWITNLAFNDGCIEFDDIDNQFVLWAEDIIICANDVIDTLTGGAIEDFFVFIFKYLFDFIQVIIDSVNIIADCFGTPEFIDCVDRYPTNCKDNGFVATGGLQTCYTILYTCWDDPHDVLLRPLFIIDFFPISKTIFVIVDTVVCPVYGFVQCVAPLTKSGCGWDCLADAFQCVQLDRGLFGAFGGSGKDTLYQLGKAIEDINDIYKSLKDIEKEIAKIADYIWPFGISKKKSVPEGPITRSDIEGMEIRKRSLYEIISQMDYVAKKTSSESSGLVVPGQEDCMSNIYFDDNEGIYAKLNPRGCEPIEAIKLAVVCFMDGGNCAMDPVYDKTIFREYSPMFTPKTLSAYSDYIWKRTIEFLNITEPNCQGALGESHPLKLLGKNSLIYSFCMKLHLPFNEMKFMQFVANNMAGNNTFAPNDTKIIGIGNDSPLVLSASQRSFTYISAARNIEINLRKQNQKVNGKPITWLVSELYTKFRRSEYAKILAEYADRSKYIRKEYTNDGTLMRAQLPNVTEIWSKTKRNTGNDEHMSAQEKLFKEYLHKLRAQFYVDKPEAAKACYKWNRYRSCRYQNDPNMIDKEAENTNLLLFSEDEGAMAVTSGYAVELFRYESIKNAEYLENDLNEQLKDFTKAMYEYTQRHSASNVMTGIDSLTGFLDWSIIKVPHSVYASIKNNDSDSLVGWINGNKKYTVKNGFEEIEDEIDESLPQNKAITQKNSMPSWDTYYEKVKEGQKSKRWGSSYDPEDTIRRYALFPFLNYRLDTKDDHDITKINVTYNGLSINNITDYLMQVENKKNPPNSTYEIMFTFANGTTQVKQFSSSNFNFNVQFIKFIDSIISWFGAPVNWLLDEYNNLIDALGKPNYVDFTKDGIINWLKFFFTCHVKENINGEYLYNIFCFPLLPIYIFEWIDYAPNQFVPTQIPWPVEIIDQNCVNTYNGRHGLLTFEFSDNCGDPGDRPFCPSINYCARTYKSCVDIGFSDDALDPWLYVFAVVPRLLNWFFFTPIPLETAEWISIFLSFLTFPIIGPMVGIIILGLLVLYWAISVFFLLAGATPGVPMSFIIALALIIVIIFAPALVSMAGLTYTISILFLTFWVYTLIFGFSGFNINVIQIIIDTTNFLNDTPPFSYVLPNLQFLVNRFERYNYGTGEIPAVDTMCFVFNYGNMALAVLIVFVSFYIMSLLAQTLYQVGLNASNIIRGGTNAGRTGSSATSTEQVASHGTVPISSQYKGTEPVRTISSNINANAREGIKYGSNNKTIQMILPQEYIDPVNTNLKVRKMTKSDKKNANGAIGHLMTPGLQTTPVSHRMVSIEPDSQPKKTRKHKPDQPKND